MATMKKQTEKKVTIYSTPTCHYCNMAKDFFNEHGIKYEVFDVSTDLAKRHEMVEKSGQLGVPVITIGDEIIVGFDRALISHLLGIED
jgi:glutaredoxin-like YruB-family protein